MVPSLPQDKAVSAERPDSKVGVVSLFAGSVVPGLLLELQSANGSDVSVPVREGMKRITPNIPPVVLWSWSGNAGASRVFFALTSGKEQDIATG
jgi:hypothetical protein